jgi:dTMP kinase
VVFKRGKLILAEGAEANGKSTIAEMIVEYLRSLGIEVIFTHEPGGSGSDIPEIVAAEKHIRSILIDPKLDIPVRSQLWLFLASRLIHMRKKVIPALEKGIWVVTDRLHLSTLVYQGIVGGISLEEIMAIEAQAREGIDPDLALVLVAEIDEVVRRLSSREAQTKQDAWGKERQLELIEGYKKIAEMFGYPIIDSTGSPDETFENVIPYLEDLIEN